MAGNFNDLHDSNLRGMPALQATRDACTNYDVKEQSDLVDAQAIFDDVISSIPMAVKPTDLQAEAKKTCLAHKENYETEVVLLNNLTSQRILLQRKAAHTLAHALCGVGVLAAFSKEAPKKVCKVFKKRNECYVKC